MKKLIPFAVAATLALGGCASGGGEQATSAMHNEKDAAAAITAAEKELASATAMNNAWRDTGSIIGKAKEAAKTGKYDDAVKLANQATQQSKDAIAQAEEQKNAGPRY